MKSQLISAIQQSVKLYPDILPYLSRKARYISALGKPYPLEAKTQDAYSRSIWNRVLELYRGEVSGGDFVDAMAQLIEEQLTKAFREALRDNELDAEQVTQEPYAPALEDMILNEFDFVDGLANDIEAARTNESGFEQFRARADMWANRYAQAYDTAQTLILSANGGKMIWVLGATEKHCPFCKDLAGIVAFASEWEELDVHPQHAPNWALTGERNGEKGCEGWQCDCSKEPTDQRRSPKAFETIMNIVSK